MFANTKDIPARRRSRPYGINKAARSSKLSLLSAFTATSSGSGGSNTTITQESYTKSRVQHGKSGRRRKTTKGTRMNDSSISSNPKASVDVFDFLVQDEVKKGKDSEFVEEEETIEDQSDPECYYRSHMSDSGISMGDSSSDGREGQRRRLQPLPEEPLYGHVMIQPPPEVPYPDRWWSWNSAPPIPAISEGFAPSHHTIHDKPIDPTHFWGPSEPTAVGTPSTAPEHRQGAILSVSGEDKSPKDIVFRSFAHITTQLLLQMQDEIADLEEELISMEKQAEKQVDSTHEKSSARGFDIQRRRTEIYQELHFKLDQYQRTLVNHNNCHAISKAADHPTSSAYKQWLERHVSPASRLPYLYGKDLRCLTNTIGFTSKMSRPHLYSVLALSVLCNGFFPLLVFKVFHNVLNRLIILMCSTAICAMVLEKLDHKMSEKEHVSCVMAVSFISLCAALIL